VKQLNSIKEAVETILRTSDNAQLNLRGITSRQDAMQLEDPGRDRRSKFNGAVTG